MGFCTTTIHPAPKHNGRHACDPIHAGQKKCLQDPGTTSVHVKHILKSPDWCQNRLITDWFAMPWAQLSPHLAVMTYATAPLNRQIPLSLRPKWPPKNVYNFPVFFQIHNKRLSSLVVLQQYRTTAVVWRRRRGREDGNSLNNLVPRYSSTAVVQP